MSTLYAYLGNQPITFGAYGSTSSIVQSSWQRPSDWLPMPNTSSMTGSGGMFVGLMAVPTGSGNFVALLARAFSGSTELSYSVNWGDGSSIQYYPSNTQAQYQYNYTNLSASTYSSGSHGAAMGYLQSLITVLPSGSNTNLTVVNLQKKHTQPGLPPTPIINWLDIAVGGSNISTLQLNQLTNVINFFELQNINIVNFSSSFTNLSYLCQNCYSLKNFSISPNITSGCTNFTNMFSNCYSLPTVPLFNTISGSSFQGMFSNCYSLSTVPLFNTQNGTIFQLMFIACNSLSSVPLFNTQNGTNFANMFNGCATLNSVPLFNTSKATSFSSMFSSCYSLQSIPLFDTRNVASFYQMFWNVPNLQSVPLFNTISGSNFQGMFYNCYSLSTVPSLNVSNATTQTGSGLFSTMFTGCSNLQFAAMSGSMSSMDYSKCNLSYPAIQQIYNLLGPTGSVPCSITTSGNWGSSSLQSSDFSVITSKGWTYLA